MLGIILHPLLSSLSHRALTQQRCPWGSAEAKPHPWEPVGLTWMWQHRLRQQVTARTDPLPRRLEEMGLVVSVTSGQR